ncbi:MAG: zf-HC2 domain-containing protein [Lachnospiraceae bacterium]|nr:zf-HC2 domain-containing protein [Lachnospiraceae bacterium]
MNCMEARRMVTPFIKRELTDKESEQFLKHIEHCSDCMDELDIYFTVYKALDSLDSGAHHESDFRKLMEEDIRSVKRGILRRRVFRIMRGVTLVLAELLLLLSVYTGFEVQRDETQQSTFHKAIHRLQNGDGSRIEAPHAETGTEKSASPGAGTEIEKSTSPDTAGAETPVSPAHVTEHEKK